MGFYFESFFIEVIVFLIPCLLLFYLWGKKKYKFFEDRGIKYIKPIFLIGSTRKIMFGLENFGKANKEIYDDLKGAKIGGFYVGFSPFLSVRDPEMIHRVLVKDFSHFHDRGMKVDIETNPLESHLFLLSGDKWRTMRMKLTPTFTSGKLKWMFQQLESCTESLLKTIEDESKDTDGEIESKDLMARFTTDVIGSCVFGLEPESIKDPNCMFRKMGREIFHPGYFQIVKNSLRFAFQDIFIKLRLRTIPQNINNFFLNLVKDMFEERLSSGKKRNDFVQLLLQLREKGSIDVDSKEDEDDDDYHQVYGQNQQADDKFEITNGLLAGQAFVFFVAGFETSATGLGFVTYLLSKNQGAQDRAREEVREAKAKHGGIISYNAIKEMNYLENCLKEAMRLYPPVPVLFRECTKSIKLDNFEIPKGMNVMVQVSGIHGDPDIYKEPHLFRPERFEEGEGSQPGTFIPFGDGPRICIGKRFAMVEMKLALARILDVYSIEPSLKMVEPIRLGIGSFVPEPLGGLWAKFKKLPN